MRLKGPFRYAVDQSHEDKLHIKNVGGETQVFFKPTHLSDEISQIATVSIADLEAGHDIRLPDGRIVHIIKEARLSLSKLRVSIGEKELRWEYVHHRKLLHIYSIVNSFFLFAASVVFAGAYSSAEVPPLFTDPKRWSDDIIVVGSFLLLVISVIVSILSSRGMALRLQKLGAFLHISLFLMLYLGVAAIVHKPNASLLGVLFKALLIVIFVPFFYPCIIGLISSLFLIIIGIPAQYDVEAKIEDWKIRNKKQ